MLLCTLIRGTPTCMASATAVMDMASALNFFPGSPSAAAAMSPSPFTSLFSPSRNGISHLPAATFKPTISTFGAQSSQSPCSARSKPRHQYPFSKSAAVDDKSKEKASEECEPLSANHGVVPGRLGGLLVDTNLDTSRTDYILPPVLTPYDVYSRCPQTSNLTKSDTVAKIANTGSEEGRNNVDSQETCETDLKKVDSKTQSAIYIGSTSADLEDDLKKLVESILQYKRRIVLYVYENTTTLLDSDDTDSLSSASSLVRSDMISVGFGADVEKDSFLDQSLDAF